MRRNDLGAKKPRRSRSGMRRPKIRKGCRFCADLELKIDCKNTALINPFITERGRIIARRFSGLCAKHQLEMTNAIKRARILAFIPFTATQVPLE